MADAIEDQPSVMAHGDFKSNQVMWCNGRVTALLDLEMSHVEAPDWDLAPFLGFCADPVRCVCQALEAATRLEDYRDAPVWLRQAYPEMFNYPQLQDRLLLHLLVLRSEKLLADPIRTDQIVSESLEEARAQRCCLTNPPGRGRLN